MEAQKCGRDQMGPHPRTAEYGQYTKGTDGRIRWFCRECQRERVARYRSSVRTPEQHEAEKERGRASHRKHYLKLKLEAFEHYGWVCECCSEDDIRFLTFDHIEGGGNAHRREIGEGRAKLLGWLRKRGWPQGVIRILCFNCNCGRSVDNGVCPHEENQT